jgi:hypothetical protein
MEPRLGLPAGVAAFRLGLGGVRCREMRLQVSGRPPEKRSGPGIRFQGDRVIARIPLAVVPIRDVVPGTARDASLMETTGPVAFGQFDARPSSIRVNPVGTRVFGECGRCLEITPVTSEICVRPISMWGGSRLRTDPRRRRRRFHHRVHEGRQPRHI